MRPAPKSKNRAHTGSMEIGAVWSYIDLTWLSNAVTWSAPNTFVDAATYSSGTPSASPTPIVIATLGRDDSAFTLGALAAVQTTIWFPFQ